MSLESHSTRTGILTLLTELSVAVPCTWCHDRSMLRAAVLLASVALVMALPAAASDAAATRSVTIRVLVQPVTRTIKDVPPKTINLVQYTKGDTIRGTSILRNAVPQFGKSKGARVGTSSFVITAVASQTLRTDGIAKFPEAPCISTAWASSTRPRRSRLSGALASTREQRALSKVDISPAVTRWRSFA